jgi:hypothetical protein
MAALSLDQKDLGCVLWFWFWFVWGVVVGWAVHVAVYRQPKMTKKMMMTK